MKQFFIQVSTQIRVRKNHLPWKYQFRNTYQYSFHLNHISKRKEKKSRSMCKISTWNMQLEWYPSRHNLILLKPDHKVTNSHRTNVWNIFPFKPSFKSNHGQRKQSSIKASILWYLTIFASHQNIIHETTVSCQRITFEI